MIMGLVLCWPVRTRRMPPVLTLTFCVQALQVRSGKVDENSVGINRGFNRGGVHRRGQRDFDAQVGACLHRGHVLHGHDPGAVLGRSPGPQEQQDRKIFLNSNHS